MAEMSEPRDAPDTTVWNDRQLEVPPPFTDDVAFDLASKLADIREAVEARRQRSEER